MAETLTPPPAPTASPAERIYWCVSVARFAPSKHNAQPWRFFVYDDGVVELYADATRALRNSDPDDRELTIGCGAALHTLALAMRGIGIRPDVRLLPDGPDGPLARVGWGGAYAPSMDEITLLAAVPARHTNRGPLDAGLIDAGTPNALQRAAEGHGTVLQLLVAPGAIDTLEALVAGAEAANAGDPAFAYELARWLRPEDDESGDGVPYGAGRPAPGVYGARFAQRTFGKEPAARVEDSPLPAVLWTAGDTQTDWLRAGMAVQAVLLRATTEGVSASFLNQPIERPETRLAVRRHIGYAGFPQLVLRLGIGADVPATPRRATTDLVHSA